MNKKAKELRIKEQRESSIVENTIEKLKTVTAGDKIDYNFKSVMNIADIFGERDSSKEVFPGVTNNKVLLVFSIHMIENVIIIVTIMQWNYIQSHRARFKKKELGTRRMFPGINSSGAEITEHPDLNLVIFLFCFATSKSININSLINSCSVIKSFKLLSLVLSSGCVGLSTNVKG